MGYKSANAGTNISTSTVTLVVARFADPDTGLVDLITMYPADQYDKVMSIHDLDRRSRKSVTGEDDLGYAAETGDLVTLARLLGQGVPADARPASDRGRTALDRAIWAEQTEAVQLLLAAGAIPSS